MGFNSGLKGLNPICHLLALLGAHHFLHVSRIRVKVCTNYIVEGDLTPKGSGLTMDIITITSLRLDLVGLMSKKT
jgi:hypothetical protein